jgi:hypothetical protein
VRIPSWLEADPALHSEAVYIEADRFFHQKILLAIGRRTIHSNPYLDTPRAMIASRSPPQNRYFTASCSSRLLIFVEEICPNELAPNEAPGFENCGVFRALNASNRTCRLCVSA